jgi:hypothetical protein
MRLFFWSGEVIAYPKDDDNVRREVVAVAEVEAVGVRDDGGTQVWAGYIEQSFITQLQSM